MAHEEAADFETITVRYVFWPGRLETRERESCNKRHANPALFNAAPG